MSKKFGNKNLAEKISEKNIRQKQNFSKKYVRLRSKKKSGQTILGQKKFRKKNLTNKFQTKKKFG